MGFCHKLGLNYVSCSPFRVPVARLAAAQAALEDAPAPKAKTTKKAVKKTAKAKTASKAVKKTAKAKTVSKAVKKTAKKVVKKKSRK